MANISQKSLWKLPRNMLPRRRSRDAPELMVAPAPAEPRLRSLHPGEQLTADIDLVVLHDESGTVYRCVGDMWCGSEQRLMLVEHEHVEQFQTEPKRCVSRESVRVVMQSEVAV